MLEMLWGRAMRASGFGFVLGTCLVALAAGPVARAADGKGKWEKLSQEDGITTWRLQVPGKDLPGFRGKVTIDATIQEIIDVMMKTEDHTKWMYKCKESRVLKELSETHAIIYNRVEAPWPVWDRDIVMDTTMKFNESRTAVTMRFKNLKGKEGARWKAPIKRVVRMPRLVGFYKMVEKDGRTRVTYEAESDIGGSIPKWLANLAAKDLPHITLERLRKRVMDTKNGTPEA